MAIWQVVPYCVMWCLWRERDACDYSRVKLLFFQTLYVGGLVRPILSQFPCGVD